MQDKITLIARYRAVLSRIAEVSMVAERQPPRLLAVTKRRCVQSIAALLACGQRDFAENTWQEAQDKIVALSQEDCVWHFIGRLQSNKLKMIAQNFDWVHSLSDFKHAAKLHGHRPLALPPLQVCLQVNITNEASKSGLSAAQVPDFIESIMQYDRLEVVGLMTMLSIQYDESEQIRYFQQCHAMQQALSQHYPQIQHCCMGMSRDYVQAIRCGASFIRLGRAIFEDSITG